jgi:hypothetical protein
MQALQISYYPYALLSAKEEGEDITNEEKLSVQRMVKKKCMTSGYLKTAKLP